MCVYVCVCVCGGVAWVSSAAYRSHDFAFTVVQSFASAAPSQAARALQRAECHAGYVRFGYACTRFPAMLAPLSCTHSACVPGWFMTLFTSMDVLPYSATVVVWDVFLVDGWKTIFRVVLALLAIAEPVLLIEEFAVIVRYLNTFPRSSIPSPRALLRAARSFKVTNRCRLVFYSLARCFACVSTQFCLIAAAVNLHADVCVSCPLIPGLRVASGNCLHWKHATRSRTLACLKMMAVASASPTCCSVRMSRRNRRPCTTRPWPLKTMKASLLN
jgi:hypothetical protein